MRVTKQSSWIATPGFTGLAMTRQAESPLNRRRSCARRRRGYHGGRTQNLPPTMITITETDYFLPEDGAAVSGLLRRPRTKAFP